MMYLLLALSWLCVAILNGGALYILALLQKNGAVLFFEPSRLTLLSEIGLFAFNIMASIVIIGLCIERLSKERREKKHGS